MDSIEATRLLEELREALSIRRLQPEAIKYHGLCGLGDGWLSLYEEGADGSIIGSDLHESISDSVDSFEILREGVAVQPHESDWPCFEGAEHAFYAVQTAAGVIWFVERWGRGTGGLGWNGPTFEEGEIRPVAVVRGSLTTAVHMTAPRIYAAQIEQLLGGEE